MNEKIDLTKILKDCPRGFKLYSVVYGEVTFFSIVNDTYSICVLTKNNNDSEYFSSDGKLYASYGECVLFPSKDQRDWSKFTAPWYKNEQKSADKIEPKFKVGDWVVNKFGDSWHIDSLDKKSYQVSDGKGNYNYSPISKQDKMHLWNIQDAKDGDVLALSWLEDKNLWEKIIIFKKYHSEGIKGLYSMPCVEGYGNTFKNGEIAWTDEEVPYYSKTWTCNLHPATKEQRDSLFQKIKEAGYKWNDETKTLEKLIKPKFKVGDKIRHKGTNKDDVYEISNVYDDSYGLFGSTWMVYMKYQDQYELVPSKFDPKTLKAFDRVLCKNGLHMWRCDFFSSYMETYVRQNVCISGSYSYCIPYNDGTKHLVGTTDEAPEYYRYWED